jgi:hypothetical protein
MPHHLAVLRHAWKQLRAGRAASSWTASRRQGPCGKLACCSDWLMKHTMLGKPFIKPWDDSPRWPTTSRWKSSCSAPGTCWGTKSAQAQTGEQVEQLMAAE